MRKWEALGGGIMGGAGRGARGVYLFFEFFELIILFLAIIFYFLLGFGFGVFDAFGAVWGWVVRGGLVEERRGREGEVGAYILELEMG